MNPDKKDPTILEADVISVENIKKPEEAELMQQNTEQGTEQKSETKPSPSEVAKQRRESVSNFINDKKENFKNKISSAGQGIKNFFGKVKAFGGKVADVAIAPDAYIASGLEKANSFVDKKAEQLNSFVEGKIALGKLFVNFAENKTVETYTELQNAIVSRYEGLKQYGNDAIEAGRNKIKETKDNSRNKKNAFIIGILKSLQEKHQARADKVARTIQNIQDIQNMQIAR